MKILATAIAEGNPDYEEIRGINFNGLELKNQAQKSSAKVIDFSG